MYDYMKALHARFCREPELQKVRAELDRSYREIKARLGQQDQETLLQLADLENELREETSLTSFIAGFRLGMGIVGEIYVKYSPLGNNHLEDFLLSEGAEPVVPGLVGFCMNEPPVGFGVPFMVQFSTVVPTALVAMACSVVVTLIVSKLTRK